MKKSQLKELIKNIIKEASLHEDEMPVTKDPDLKRGVEPVMGFVNVEESGRGNGRPCNCGSGLPSEEIHDARGIYVGRVCKKCKKEKLKGFRKDIFTDPNYQTDEPIEPDEYEEQSSSGAAGGFATPFAFKKKKIREIDDTTGGLPEISHGFYEINRNLASKLSSGPLPQPGFEKLVGAPAGFKTKNGFVWLTLTRHNEKLVWSIRDAGNWKLENNVAVLSAGGLDEMTGTGAVAGYQTPFFGGSGKRAMDVTKKLGYKQVEKRPKRT